MILIDSNIPMYLVGTSSPHKTDAQRLLERLVSERQRLVTDAEVLQEILHRYVAINRRHDIQPAFDSLRSVCTESCPSTGPLSSAQNRLLLRSASPRVMQFIWPHGKHGIQRILTFDSGFDGFPGVTRLS